MTRCKDCIAEGVTTERPAPHPGPRCSTHARRFLRVQKSSRHSKYTQTNYGLPEGSYAAIKAYQGGTCALCRRATGASKNLAVEHDHKCCPGKTSCGSCVRGLCCGPCNSVLALARDDPAYFQRAIDYLAYPPYQRHLDDLSNADV